jgi:hypothetical protein
MRRKTVLVPELDINPLEWWKNNYTTLPNLYKNARKYLSIQATSCASERVFSKGGYIYDDYRRSLNDEHGKQLILLSMNKDYVN